MIGILAVYLGLALAALGGRALRELRRFDRVALVAFLLLAAATRPDLDRHRTAVVRAIAADPFTGGRMQSAAARAATASDVSRQVELADYGLFTVGIRRRSLVGVGLFGRVFVRAKPAG